MWRIKNDIIVCIVTIIWVKYFISLLYVLHNMHKIIYYRQRWQHRIIVCTRDTAFIASRATTNHVFGDKSSKKNISMKRNVYNTYCSNNFFLNVLTTLGTWRSSSFSHRWRCTALEHIVSISINDLVE